MNMKRLESSSTKTDSYHFNRGLGRPYSRLYQNDSLDYTGHNGLNHVPDSNRTGLSNSVYNGAYALTACGYP